LRDVEIVEKNCDAEYKTRFEEAMNDDFNTPVLHKGLYLLATSLVIIAVPKPEFGNWVIYSRKRVCKKAHPAWLTSDLLRNIS
jgi:hypothetical protein